MHGWIVCDVLIIIKDYERRIDNSRAVSRGLCVSIFAKFDSRVWYLQS